MNAMPAFFLAAAAAACALVDSPKGLNGDMEDIAETAKGMNRSLMRLMQRGCDFGNTPVAYTPRGWGINTGTAAFYSIDAAEVPEERGNVHSGNASMYFCPKTFSHIHNQSCRIEPGKYEVSLWVRGTGTVSVATYNYGDAYHCLGPGPVLLKATATSTWTRHAATVSIGDAKPGTAYSVLVLMASPPSILYIDDVVLSRQSVVIPGE